MKRFIIGLIVGIVLGSVATGIAALPAGRQPREYDKFTLDTSDNVCVLVTIME